MVKKLKLTIKPPQNRKISTYFSIFSNFFANIKYFFYKYMDRPGTLLKKKFFLTTTKFFFTNTWTDTSIKTISLQL